jgi:hypothetical protein
MAGISFAILEIEGKKYPTAVKVTGGITTFKNREVPDANIGGTMRKEATGGVEREDGEIEFLELADEGFTLDDVYAEFQAWHANADRTQRRKTMSLAFYSDLGLTKPVGRRNWLGVWPISVSGLEFDKASDDARKFTVNFSHLNTEPDYKAAGGVAGGA